MFYHVHLISSKVSQEEVFVVKTGIFQANLPPIDKLFPVHTIASPLLFKHRNVCGIDIWERVKLESSKKVS